MLGEVGMRAVIRQFLKMEAAGGVLLMGMTALAMIFANSAALPLYQWAIYTPINLLMIPFFSSKSLLWWVNDGLMVLFFLLIGLEVKRELLIGALATRSQAILPVVAALGGMIFPALIYLAFNGHDSVARAGWAIPVSTDIAFSLGVVALLGQRVPSTLKVFLLALAIIDDLGVIVILSLFYTHQPSFPALGAVALIIGLMVFINARGITTVSVYLLLGALLWVALLHSGIHATLAGVVSGFAIPINRWPRLAILDPAQQLERRLYPWVAFLILPLFAFANAGIALNGVSIEKLLSALPLGIALGLLVGKPLGILSCSWLSVRLGWARLPSGVRFFDLFAVSVLCGIGFTMSIFIATCTFESVEADYSLYARLAILLGSTLAAIIGYQLLARRYPIQIV